MSRKHERFAEMYVAGLMVDLGWEVYFPVRDTGFDFVAIWKPSDGSDPVIRPVQVKSKTFWPEGNIAQKGASKFGFQGDLSTLHTEMILAVVFFNVGATELHPLRVAAAPQEAILRTRTKYSFEPCSVRGCELAIREGFSGYFGQEALDAAKSRRWTSQRPGTPPIRHDGVAS